MLFLRVYGQRYNNMFWLNQRMSSRVKPEKTLTYKAVRQSENQWQKQLYD